MAKLTEFKSNQITMIKLKIKKIVQKIVSKKIKITDKKDLIKNNVLDSLSIMMLLSELEKEFKIKIKMKNFKIENIRSINLIKKMIKNYEKKN